MSLLPPGPFPPTGDAAHDLGVRIRDEFYSRAWIEGPGRTALSGQLRDALRSGNLRASSETMSVFLDTWPLAALVDDARETWAAAPNGRALAILGVAAGVVARATGWGPMGEGPWPLPGPEWIRENGGEGPWEVVRRGRFDGAEAVGSALGVAVPAERPVPPVLAEVAAAELATRRAELGSGLATGALAAVRIHGVATGAPAQLALGEIRLEGRAQSAFEQLGECALLAGAVPAWGDVLSPPAPGVEGITLATTCSWATLPGTPGGLAAGKVKPVTYLLWDGPHAPIAVDPSVMPVLAQARSGATRAELGEPDVVDQLIALGALSAL